MKIKCSRICLNFKDCLPNEPLFLVGRSWKTNKSSSRPLLCDIFCHHWISRISNLCVGGTYHFAMDDVCGCFNKICNQVNCQKSCCQACLTHLFSVLVLRCLLPPSSQHIKWLVSSGLAQISEFCFVLSSRARRLKIISREVYLLILSTTTLSLLLAPVLWRVSIWSFNNSRKRYHASVDRV